MYESFDPLMNNLLAVVYISSRCVMQADLCFEFAILVLRYEENAAMPYCKRAFSVGR